MVAAMIASSRLTPAGTVSPCHMAGPWERAKCDLAITTTSSAQAPPAAGVDNGTVSRDRVAVARVGYGT